MKFRSRRVRRSPAEISLVPLIDLFLNILVFFLVSTTFASDTVFFVDLPESKPGQSVAEKKQISISVSAAGDIAMDKRILTLEELKEELSKEPQEVRASLPVIVRADKESRHGAVVAVVDVARRLGIQNIGIVTKPAP